MGLTLQSQMEVDGFAGFEPKLEREEMSNLVTLGCSGFYQSGTSDCATRRITTSGFTDSASRHSSALSLMSILVSLLKNLQIET